MVGQAARAPQTEPGLHRVIERNAAAELVPRAGRGVQAAASAVITIRVGRTGPEPRTYSTSGGTITSSTITTPSNPGQ